MGRELSETKLALMRAGEEMFAAYGIDGARVSDILRAADQANDSAINYHFGSRWGLVLAIVEWHVTEMERRREPPSGSLRDLVAGIVVPSAAALTTQEGRYFLRLANQLVDRSSLPIQDVPGFLAGTILLDQLSALQAAMTHLPEPVRADRLHHFIVFQVCACAIRAQRIDAGEADLLDRHDEYVADLVAVLTAVLEADHQ